MINNIKREGILVINIVKKGREKIFILENGLKINGTEFRKSNDFEIQCSKLNIWIKNKVFQPIWLKKEYVSSKYHGLGKNNPFYGKKHSDEFKDKLSQERKGKWHVGENNPMYGKTPYDIWLEKYGKEEADKRHFESAMKNSELSYGKNNPMYNKSVYSIWLEKYGREEADKRQLLLLEKRKKILNTPEQKQRLSLQMKKANKQQKAKNYNKYIDDKRKAAKASHKSQSKYKKNKIEIIVENWLLEHNIACEWSPIIGLYQYDFIIHNRRILIEVNGDYWHVNPKIYGDKLFKDLKDYQRSKIIIDLKKKIYAHERDFRIITIWENDINKHNFDILKELL